MPYVPPELTRFSAPSLFSTATEYPSGLFDIPDPGSPYRGLAGLGAAALTKAGISGAGKLFGPKPLDGAAAAEFANMRHINGGSGGSLFGGLADMGLNVGASILGSKLGTWGGGNTGSSIGGGIGGAAGSLLGPAGSFLGSAIGSALGGNFGPPPTRGPNLQGWLGRNAMGQLDILGASGDNGVGGDDARAAFAGPVNAVNAYLMRSKQTLGDLPKYFQVRAGGDGMDPTIEIGDNVDNAFLAPMLNDNSLLKTLIGRGYLKGDLAELGGPDPRRIFNGTGWAEPESIHPVWRGGIFTAPSGYEAFDSGRVGNILLDAMAAGHVITNDNPALNEFAASYDPSKSLFTNQSLFSV